MLKHGELNNLLVGLLVYKVSRACERFWSVGLDLLMVDGVLRMERGCVSHRWHHVWGYFRSDCSDPSPSARRGCPLPSCLLLLSHPPLLSHHLHLLLSDPLCCPVLYSLYFLSLFYFSAGPVHFCVSLSLHIFLKMSPVQQLQTGTDLQYQDVRNTQVYVP